MCIHRHATRSAARVHRFVRRGDGPRGTFWQSHDTPTGNGLATTQVISDPIDIVVESFG
jgi:hypothetical protein